MIGTSHGSTLTGLRYRAENAHRLPNTTSGWYLYHKTKNYEMAWGGLREGVKLGFKVAFWTAGFFGIENSIDQCRGSKDVLSTVLASLSVAGGFSLWSMHPIFHAPIKVFEPADPGVDQFAMVEAVRTAKQALAIGLAYGFTQDALGYMRGRKLGYVDFLLRSRRGNAKLEGSTTT